MIEKKLIERSKDSYTRCLVSFCKNHKRIFIYGAGEICGKVILDLKKGEIKPYQIIVSDGHCTTTRIYNLDVIELSNACIGEEDGVILALSDLYQNEVRELLKLKGISKRDIFSQRMSDRYLFNRCEATATSVNSGFFSAYSKLDGLGIECGTDKSSRELNYLNKYEFFLNKFAGEINILELGVHKGSSIEMWHRYYPEANVIGVDIDSNCRKYEKDRITIKIGDLSDPDFLDSLTQYNPNIVIDDASHIWSHQIAALYHLFSSVKPGGIYILEDTVTSFSTWDGMGYDDLDFSAYEFLQAVGMVVSSGEPLRSIDCKKEVLMFKDEIEEIAKEIEMIVFIQGSCMMIKR